MSVVIVEKSLCRTSFRVVHMCHPSRVSEIGIEILPEPFVDRLLVAPGLRPGHETSEMVVMECDANCDVIFDAQKLLDFSSSVVPESTKFLFRIFSFSDLFHATSHVVVQDLDGVLRTSGQDLLNSVSLVVLQGHFANSPVLKSNQVSIFVISKIFKN